MRTGRRRIAGLRALLRRPAASSSSTANGPPSRRSARGCPRKDFVSRCPRRASRCSLRELLRSGSLLLDAAMGTALMSRGLTGRAPEWNLSHPNVVRDVHAAHVAAGAEMVLTNTFVGASAEEAAAAIRLARASGARYVGGALWAGAPDLAPQHAQLAEPAC